MKQKLILILCSLLLSFGAFAQQVVELRGNVINSASGEPVAGVQVTIRGQNQSQVTDAQGQFYFPSVAVGKDVLTLSSSDIITTEIPVNFIVNASNLLKDIKVDVIGRFENVAVAGILDEAFIDDESPTQEISTMIIMSNDVFLNKVGYQLSPFRFQTRGYENIYQDKYINGVKFNDQNRGVFNYSSIGALNDMTRNGDAVNFHDPNTFTYGNIGGTENINMRAGSFSRGGKLTLSYTNRNYYLRGMATYSTGLSDDGFAFTMSVGGRYADEGLQVKGTSYRNISYALALEKQWQGGRHSISLTTFGSPVERGQQGSSVQEVYDLVGDNLYNPNWGLQNGKKRNSRMVRAFDPTVILSHVWKINRKATLTTGYGMHYQYDRRTALNWYDGADPRPDYYRFLPSYFDQMGATDVADNYRDRWSSKDTKLTQVDWDQMFWINKYGQRADDGDPNAAIYMVEGRRSDLFEHTINSTFNLDLPNNQKLTLGLGLRTTESKQFKEVVDLLGSQYAIDIDKFAKRDAPIELDEQAREDFIQNNMLFPNRKVYKGDTFGYNYALNIHSADLWFQNQHSTRNMDIYYGGKVEWSSFSRRGKMQNGKYPDQSYGRGKSHTFIDFGFKTGMTYKFSGRHFLSANVNFTTQSPLPNNSYISPRIFDGTPDGLKSEKIFSADINYIWSLPSFRGRVSVYQTYFFDRMKRISYYFDNALGMGGGGAFMNHILTGINSSHRGVEIGTTYQLDDNWSFDLVGTLAEYYYTNNPEGTLHFEAGTNDPMTEKVYMKDVYVGGVPQFAGTLGINYFYKYWFLNLNINGIARSYIDVAPLRRMSSVYTELNPLIPEDYAAFRTLTDQERFGSSYTLDFSVGKIFYLPKRQSINMNLSFNNILNRKNVKTGGYQQGRSDTEAPTKFANKYYYMPGFNCFLNASYRF